MVSSHAMSLEFRRFCMSAYGIGGGDDEGGPGETELRLDRLEVLEALEVREGVRYGVLVDEGSIAEVAAEYSSSVSHNMEDMSDV